MLNSMTGFGGGQLKIPRLGKVSVELRSTNHKFLDIVLHLPEGFLSLEDRVKRAVEAKIKRGRITCAVNISGQELPTVFINERLLKDYIRGLRNIKHGFGLKDEVRLDTLIHLPGVLSLAESKVPKEQIWPRLNLLVNQAIDKLVKMRQKEGRALGIYLRRQAQVLSHHLVAVGLNSKKAVQDKCRQFKTDEERASFIKETDIAEELQRLAFHIRNFKNKLSQAGPIGKELDFIAQEMQREANTMAAKSCSAAISGRAVQIKSQIEKIREQVQNIE
ncbi:MAG: YicC family protein [Candidatus Omnitrophica bacterium]|nr:YicC family protein [Candidatus Omnitrophota bacterium]